MKKLLFSLIFLFVAVPQIYAAPASLSLDPTTVSVKKGETFKVAVNMFSGDQPVASTDIMINYDKLLLEPLPDATENGKIFNTIDAKVIVPGKLYVYGIKENRNQAQPALDTVATVSFKALKPGNATLSFDCNQRTKNTSKIIENNSELSDIISCNATVTHTTLVSISDGAVLGVYTNIFSGINGFTAIFGVIVATATFFLFIRYQRLRKDLS